MSTGPRFWSSEKWRGPLGSGLSSPAIMPLLLPRAPCYQIPPFPPPPSWSVRSAPAFKAESRRCPAFSGVLQPPIPHPVLPVLPAFGDLALCPCSSHYLDYSWKISLSVPPQHCHNPPLPLIYGPVSSWNGKKVNSRQTTQ